MMAQGPVRRRAFLRVVGGAGALSLVGSPWGSKVARASATTKTVLKWWVAPPGGPWVAMATAISELVKKKTGYTLEVGSGGGVVNMFAVNKGDGDFGFTQSEVLPSAWAGKDILGVYPFKEPLQNLRQVFLMTPGYLHVAVWAGSPAKEISDLKGLRVDAKPVGFAAEALFHFVVRAHDMTYKDMKVSHLGMTDSVLAMKDGHLDAYMLNGPIPMAVFLDLATFKPIRLLAIREQVMKKITAMNVGLKVGTIPAGAYRGHTQQVLTTRNDLVAFCHKDLPADQIYRITAAYVDGLGHLGKAYKPFLGVEPKETAAFRGLPLHPGAEKYYKEAGLI